MSRLVCPHCGRRLDRWDQPRITVDALVANPSHEVLLIERGHFPPGWALPGGFVDAGESLEQAVARELLEETGLTARELTQFHTYSQPGRDPRHPTVTTVFLAVAEGDLSAGDDARRAAYFPLDRLPAMAFDHGDILKDWESYRRTGARPRVRLDGR